MGGGCPKCMFADFNKSLHLLAIFLTKYKAMRGGSRFWHSKVEAVNSILFIYSLEMQKSSLLISAHKRRKSYTVTWLWSNVKILREERKKVRPEGAFLPNTHVSFFS